jgi:hypothetical protein
LFALIAGLGQLLTGLYRSWMLFGYDAGLAAAVIFTWSFA